MPHAAAGKRIDPPVSLPSAPKAQSCRRGDTRATRRRASVAVGVPRIARDVELRMIPPHGPFGEVEFAEHDGTGSLQPGHHGGVKVRDMLGQDPGAAHGAHAPGITQVFDRHRNAVQGATVGSGADLPLCRSGRLQGLVGHDGGIALQVLVELLDALQEGLCHVNG